MVVGPVITSFAWSSIVGEYIFYSAIATDVVVVSDL
jgi:hypothetical protein